MVYKPLSYTLQDKLARVYRQDLVIADTQIIELKSALQF
jgi:hypothetical protein